MRGIRYIILHHSATDYQANKEDIDGKQVGRVICERAKERWKDKYLNYRCDYHFLIGHTGKVFTGQPIENSSWHCTNYEANLISIGICFLGNFERITMPIEQFNTGVKLVKSLMEQYDIPLKNILRHKDVISDITHHSNSTLCPGKNFPYLELLDALRDGEPFFDIGEDYKYIKEIKYLKEKGIIKGDGKGYFNPDESITREEVALVAYRIVKLLLK
ncbi:MAG: N-acetylmuramoyl-L-alanine amidase [Caldisericota bacterium]|nr:N-acetylmuramoyl-L-alanine amidase [Caldisericota bacterium]